MSTVLRHAVFGQPIAHSLSPRIHPRFAEAAGIVIRYEAIEAAPEQFAAILARFHAEGGIGANVTLPLKEQALTLCQSLTPAAQRAGAVNTLIRTETGWQGDNTDGIGLRRDLLDNLGFALQGRRVLLLGAGGAARGVAPALLDARIASLMLCNRSLERAQALQAALDAAAQVSVCRFSELAAAGSFDLVLNATSASRGGQLPELPTQLLGPGALAYDLSYGQAAEPFLHWAGQAGARASDGLGMLVEQAAEAFQRWHAIRPDSAPVLAWLRQV